MKIKLCFLLVLIFLLSFISCNIVFAQVNSVMNAGFEGGSGDNISAWDKNVWDKNAGVTKIKFDETQKHSGNRSVFITNNSPNDARLEQEINVDKNSYYKLSCWIKTENVGMGNKGANLSVAGILDTSKDIRGTDNTWEYIELYGMTSEKQKNFNLTIGIGGYSSTNTGKAWFDDVAVEKLDKLPSGVSAVKLFSEKTPTASKNTEVNKPVVYGNGMIAYTIIYFLIFALLYFLIRKIPINMHAGSEKVWLYAILLAGLVLRIILAPKIEGMPNDIACFKGWASAAANNLTGLYKSGMFLDYPPFYMYVLAIIGKIASIPGLGINYTLLVKLPPILADIATTFLLYRLSLKHLNKEMSLLIAGAFVFNPAILLNSTIWGMVDSFFTLLVIVFLLLIINGRPEYSSIFLAAAVLMKPQGIFFAPVLLFELIKRRNLKTLILTFIYGIIASIIIILPFSIGQDPLWIVNLYMKTASGYTHASMNAYNLFSLAGANLRQDSSTWLLLSYGTWGIIFDILVVLYSGYIYIKGKHEATPFMVAIMLNTGAFTLSSRMHERYMYPVVALVLILFVFLKDKRLPVVFVSISAIVFLNMHDVLYRALNLGSPHIPPDNSMLFWGSLVSVLTFAFLAKLSFDTMIRGRILPFNPENIGKVRKISQKADKKSAIGR